MCQTVLERGALILSHRVLPSPTGWCFEVISDYHRTSTHFQGTTLIGASVRIWSKLGVHEFGSMELYRRVAKRLFSAREITRQ